MSSLIIGDFNRIRKVKSANRNDGHKQAKVTVYRRLLIHSAKVFIPLKVSPSGIFYKNTYLLIILFS
jgi:hypothetical protein